MNLYFVTIQVGQIIRTERVIAVDICDVIIEAQQQDWDILSIESAIGTDLGQKMPSSYQAVV